MLDNLVFNNNGSYEGLVTFGLQQSGLNMILIIAHTIVLRHLDVQKFIFFRYSSKSVSLFKL
ncbi:hypothetical protein BDF21DRAFT_426522 [Thamnidium elegans]|nr:hypothetical protein BDF21DRAFT_426521 [Thamnidium elegans]KAI8067366.1 hypothetical protein BDF21DRAFT_426522 [Thamnidium elegans]